MNYVSSFRYNLSECPCCNREITISKDGLLRPHNNKTKKCKGSGKTYKVPGKTYKEYVVWPKTKKLRDELIERVRNNTEIQKELYGQHECSVSLMCFK